MANDMGRGVVGRTIVFQGRRYRVTWVSKYYIGFESKTKTGSARREKVRFVRGDFRA